MRMVVIVLIILILVTLPGALRAEFALKTIIPNVASIDSRHGAVTQKAIAVTSDERFAYVIDGENPRLAIFDIQQRQINYLPTPGYPVNIVLDENGKGCYVTTIDLMKTTTSLVKVSADANQATVLADSADGLPYDLSLSSDENLIYIIFHWSGKLVSFDPKGRRMEELLRFDAYRDGKPLSIVVDSQNERAFVTHAFYPGANLSVINLTERKIINRIPIGGNFIKMSPDEKRLYVAGTSIIEIDISSPVVTEIKRVFPLDGGCAGMDISPDGRLLFVTYVRDSLTKGRLFRRLIVLNLETFSIVQTLSFKETAKDVATSPDGNRLYVRVWPRGLMILERE